MSTKVITGKVRFSYVNIFKSRAFQAGQDAKYSVCLLIPKEDKATLTKIHKAVEVAKEDAKGKKWGGKVPANLKLPLRDGDIDRPDDENYAGHMFLNATSKDAPQIVDRKVQPILDPMECGSGDYCNVSVNFYAFNTNGNQGVGVGLNNIQKLKDDTRLGAARASAESDFGDGFEDDEDDDF
ncbi:MAG: DUF2815 family protein [Bacteroidales bacterium]|nr:DUF2815 family protein [Bacteroidales bacterium]